MNSPDRARSALYALDPGCPRDEWVRIAMAAKDAGLTPEDFTDWSSQAANFANERDCAAVWRSIKPGQVRAGTLFAQAFGAGWRDPDSGRLKGRRMPAAKAQRQSDNAKSNGAKTPAIEAAEAWAQCVPATAEHSYIAAKQGVADGLRVVPATSPLTIAGERMAGWLAVPVQDAGGKLVSVQFIAPAEVAPKLKAKGIASKLNLPGAPMAGTFTVGELQPGGVAYLVEGIGTAWACYRATGHPAVVCFGWGSVEARAKELRQRDDAAVLVLVPDVGKEAKAREIGRTVRACVASMPPGWPTNADMGDLSQREGIEAVEDALLRAEVLPEAAPRFRLLNSAELHALPPLSWRIRGVLPAEGLASVYGPSGSGKSFLALDMAAAIGEGREWFSHRALPATVVYCALEGEAGIRTRVAAWEKANARTMPVRLMLQPFRLTDAQDVRDLADAIARVGNGAVVLLDTLNRAAPTADENSSKDMGAILEGAKDLQRLTGGLVVLVHHTGKDANKGLRGHSSLFAGLDAAVEVSRQGAVREWKLAKCKDGEDGEAHAFSLRVIDLGTDSDGEPVTSCVTQCEAGPVEVKRAKLPQGGNQRAAWDALGPLLAKGRTGIDGAPAHRPCIELVAAIGGVAASMVEVDPSRRNERAKQAITGLVGRGLLTSRDGWLWTA